MKNITEIIEEQGYDYINTTKGRNGYPSQLSHAIITETFTELEEIKEELIEQGYDAEMVVAEKREGHLIWLVNGVTYDNSEVQPEIDEFRSIDINLDEVSDVYGTISTLFDAELDELSDKLNEVDERYEAFERLCDIQCKIEDIESSVSLISGVVTIAYDRDNDEYEVYTAEELKESVRGHYDVYTKQLAIIINE